MVQVEVRITTPPLILSQLTNSYLRSTAQSKTTPNVRKILQSQKTFANHLDDYQALVILAETNPAAAAALTNAAPPKPAAPPTSARNSPAPSATPSNTSKRSAAQAKRAALAAANEKKEAAKKAAAAAAKSKAEAEAAQETRASADDDVEMTDAPAAQEGSTAGESTPHSNGDSAEPQVQPAPQIYPPDGTILPPYKRPPPPTHPGDNDPLLVSYVPGFPTDEELRALMTAPALNYLEARASWGEEETRYPHRSFCEVCGYWGRVRCMKCGSRACALDCLNTHKDECERRYGL